MNNTNITYNINFNFQTAMSVLTLIAFIGWVFTRFFDPLGWIIFLWIATKVIYNIGIFVKGKYNKSDATHKRSSTIKSSTTSSNR